MNNTQSSPPKLFLLPRGNLGNQMLQLIFAVSLQDQVPDLQIFGYDMPVWNLSNVGRLGWKHLTPSVRLRETDGIGLVDLFKSGSLRRAKVQDVPLRCTLFAPPARFQSMFPLPFDVKPSTRDDELLIHVRGGDILAASNPNYGPIPIDWYRHLIDTSGLSPVFLGQLGNDYYSDLLRASFPRARFAEPQGVLADFAAIRQARHIAISVSTFGWLASWLSMAQSIHVPVYGIFNPAQRPDIWMLPLSDPRYRFYKFPIRTWSASPAQIAELSADFPVEELSLNSISDLSGQMEAARRGLRDKAMRSLRWRAPVSFLPQIGA